MLCAVWTRACLLFDSVSLLVKTVGKTNGVTPEGPFEAQERNAGDGKISFCLGWGESVQSNMGGVQSVVRGEEGGAIFGGKC